MLVSSAANEYKRMIQNAHLEISRRLEIISKEYQNYNIDTLAYELNMIRNHLCLIQRGLIFLKNKDGV